MMQNLSVKSPKEDLIAQRKKQLEKVEKLKLDDMADDLSKFLMKSPPKPGTKSLLQKKKVKDLLALEKKTKIEVEELKAKLLNAKVKAYKSPTKPQSVRSRSVPGRGGAVARGGYVGRSGEKGTKRGNRHLSPSDDQYYQKSRGRSVSSRGRGGRGGSRGGSSRGSSRGRAQRPDKKKYTFESAEYQMVKGMKNFKFSPEKKRYKSTTKEDYAATAADKQRKREIANLEKMIKDEKLKMKILQKKNALKKRKPNKPTSVGSRYRQYQNFPQINLPAYKGKSKMKSLLSKIPDDDDSDTPMPLASPNKPSPPKIFSMESTNTGPLKMRSPTKYHPPATPDVEMAYAADDVFEPPQQQQVLQQMTPQQQQALQHQQALHQQQILQQQGLHHQQALQQQALHQQQQALLQPALQQQQQPALQQQALPPLPEPTDEEMDYLMNSPPRGSPQKSPSPRIIKDVVMSEDPESPGYKFFKWALKRQKDFNAPPTAMFDQGLWREFLNSRVGRGGLFPEPSKFEEEEEELVLSPLTKKKDMLQKLEQLKLSTPAADTDTLKKLEQMTIEYNDAYEKTQAMLDYYKKSRDDYYKRTFQQQAVARKRRASLESGLVEGNAKRLRNQLNTYARRRSDPETGMWHETVDDWWKMVDRFEAAKARNRRQKVYKGMERAKIPDDPKLRDSLHKVWQDSQRAVREGAMRKDHQQYYEKQMQEAIHESMREHGEKNFFPKKKE